MTIETELDGEPVQVEGIVYAIGRPGKLTGPPEFCYPYEPHTYEILAVYSEAGEDILEFLTQEQLDELEAAFYEAIA